MASDRVNVADQRRDPDSLLNWTERVIRARKECPEISWGDWQILRSGTEQVLAMRYDWEGQTAVFVHNFAAKPCAVRLRVDGPERRHAREPAGAVGEPRRRERASHRSNSNRTATAGSAPAR